MEADVKCATVDIKGKGSFLIPATVEEKLSTRFTAGLAGKKGVQEPEIAENSGMLHLQVEFPGKGYENASISAPGLEVLFEEEVEFI